eukprot:222922-Amphidinium_carterae.1
MVSDGREIFGANWSARAAIAPGPGNSITIEIGGINSSAASTPQVVFQACIQYMCKKRVRRAISGQQKMQRSSEARIANAYPRRSNKI